MIGLSVSQKKQRSVRAAGTPSDVKRRHGWSDDLLPVSANLPCCFVARTSVVATTMSIATAYSLVLFIVAISGGQQSLAHSRYAIFVFSTKGYLLHRYNLPYAHTEIA